MGITYLKCKFLYCSCNLNVRIPSIKTTGELNYYHK